MDNQGLDALNSDKQTPMKIGSLITVFKPHWHPTQRMAGNQTPGFRMFFLIFFNLDTYGQAGFQDLSRSQRCTTALIRNQISQEFITINGYSKSGPYNCLFVDCDRQSVCLGLASM